MPSGFCFCGIARRPAAGAFGELADLGARRASRRPPRASPSGVDRLHERVAELGDRPARRCARAPRARRGRARRRRPRAGRPRRPAAAPSSRSRSDRTRRASRPRRRAVRAGRRSRSSRVRARRDAAQPVRGAQPDRRRHGVLREGARGRGLVAVRRGEARRARASVCAAGRRRCAHARRATSIIAESRMSWLVAPRWISPPQSGHRRPPSSRR